MMEKKVQVYESDFGLATHRPLDEKYDEAIKEAWEKAEHQAYRSYYAHFSISGFSGKNRKHDCLKSGVWCLPNALKRPQDIIAYVRAILKP